MTDPTMDRLDTHLAFLDAEADAQDRREALDALRQRVDLGNLVLSTIHADSERILSPHTHQQMTT
jgi:hypothetical protein